MRVPTGTVAFSMAEGVTIPTLRLGGVWIAMIAESDKQCRSVR
jgi:hypothetical protein